MTDAEELQALLLNTRNDDGGWPSHRGRSWTEPTALALLALQGEAVSSKALAPSASWLSQRQASDGGWPPCAIVPQSTWVTSLALLTLAQEKEYSSGCAKGLLWLSDHVYPELNGLQALIHDAIGLTPNLAPGSSPWFPGTAGWVIPSAFSILALSCWSARWQDSRFDKTIQRAQTYLLSHRCADGGWNHGGSPQRSETAPSYAETTGLALLALKNHRSAAIDSAIHLAQEFLQKPDSTEGLCWLIIGLGAHGVLTPSDLQRKARPRSTQETALLLLALQTQRGHNAFLRIPA